MVESKGYDLQTVIQLNEGKIEDLNPDRTLGMIERVQLTPATLPESFIWAGRFRTSWEIFFMLSAGFSVGIIVSLFTKRVNEDKLEKVYSCLRTPVTEDELPWSLEHIFSENRVKRALQEFDPSSAAGPDGIRPIMLQNRQTNTAVFVTKRKTFFQLKKLKNGFPESSGHRFQTLFAADGASGPKCVSLFTAYSEGSHIDIR